MSRPFKLYRLQQLDSQLDWIQNRLGEIEVALSANESVRQAEETDRLAQEDLHQASKALSQAEDQVRQQRIKIEQDESSLYGGRIRNPKELKDLESEVAALKRYLSVLEDRQLEAMLVEEQAAVAQKLTGQDLDEARARFAAQSAEMVQEKERLLREQERFKEERDASLGSIPAEDLAQYQLLRQKRKGIAVARVADRACAACGSTLNAALLNAAHSPNQLSMCDHCGRILYTG